MLSTEELARVDPMLRAYARRALGQRGPVEDLVQETLAAAVEQSFQGKSSLGTWLIGILSHKIVDHLRRQSRQSWVPITGGEDPDLLVSHARSPERVLDQRQAIEILDRALPGLPDQERMAVLMVDVEGIAREEVCRALAVRPTHLRVLLHRGRHRLRRVLESADLPGRP